MSADNKTLPDGALIPTIFPETEFDGIRYIVPSWNQMGDVSFNLAQKILTSGQKFNRIVALAKGGLTWARTMSDNLGIDALSPMRMKSYTGIGTSDEVQLIEDLAVSVEGEDLLLFDEVIDSGRSVEAAIKHLLEVKRAKSVTIATLCYKPHSTVKPDFYGFQTSAWVVFPHEIREFVEASLHTWRQNGVSEEDIAARFATLRIPDNQTRLFTDLYDRTNGRR